MIEFEKEIRIYSNKLQDIYCCDCFFERVTSLVFRSEEFSACDEFIQILKEEFQKNFLFLYFAGVIVLICKSLLKFIFKNKKDHEPLLMKKCITDVVFVDGERIIICIVCLIKIIESNKILKHFTLKKEYRNEMEYLYL